MKGSFPSTVLKYMGGGFSSSSGDHDDSLNSNAVATQSVNCRSHGCTCGVDVIQKQDRLGRFAAKEGFTEGEGSSQVLFSRFGRERELSFSDFGTIETVEFQGQAGNFTKLLCEQICLVETPLFAFAGVNWNRNDGGFRC